MASTLDVGADSQIDNGLASNSYVDIELVRDSDSSEYLPCDFLPLFNIEDIPGTLATDSDIPTPHEPDILVSEDPPTIGSLEL